MPAAMPPTLLAALIALNLLTFAAFGLDKALARRGRRRISEARLLQFAFFGGTPAAYAARSLFRHKTRKQPFCARLHAIAVAQALGGAGLWYWLAQGSRP